VEVAQHGGGNAFARKGENPARAARTRTRTGAPKDTGPPSPRTRPGGAEAADVDNACGAAAQRPMMAR
jgi:hypothetical protein